MTHFILIRFLCNKINYSEEQLYSNEIFKMRLQLLKNNALTTLANQTDLNFNVCILINNKFANENKIQLQNIISNYKKLFNCYILNIDEINEFILEKTKNDKIYAITRLDDDDFIHKDANKIIQQLNTFDNSITCYGYTNGYVYNSITNDLYNYYYDYNNNGHIAIFQTLIFNNIKYMNKFFIFRLSHTNMIESFNKLNVKLNFIQNTNPNMFIYFRHQNNDSINSFRLPNKYSNIKYELTNNKKQFLQNQFGIKL